ncbi:NEDD8 ultimate buster 1 [Chanos chanos]|uniref:NEDD8 ultimate buster 1 n=1 Tax=Chanos chanos TaxID=29144 RepID=A0A6J2UYM8_CHACN|nr:NEDD8 ultimate buster 1 [Chanos chanos]
MLPSDKTVEFPLFAGQTITFVLPDADALHFSTKRKMTEEYIHSKLISLLRNEKIELWNPPYTTDDEQPGQQVIQELAEKYSSCIGISVLEVVAVLEDIRLQALIKGRGNKQFKETSVATLEINLPRPSQESEKDEKKRKYKMQTKLDVTAQEFMNKITEEFGFEYFTLIVSGKKLSPDKTLQEQNVKNNSKVMILKQATPEKKEEMVKDDEKNRSQNESLRRTQKGFEILSERDGSEDPETTPFLEIADQKGNPLQIPPEEKKALILAMGFHEKGRALMKRREYEGALDHLTQADEQFSKCESRLLEMVDNYAVLQLDIVWCYRALEASHCLDNGLQRLKTAEECFKKCYGDGYSRLQQIKGNTGGEQVLFLRLYLLQSVLAYAKGKEKESMEKLKQAEELYSRLNLDPEKMDQLMSMGFSEQEARLALRACSGDVSRAAQHITQRREEKKKLKREEREKRRRRLDSINTLVGLGFTRREAAEALHKAKGNIDQAYVNLLDSTRAFSEANDSRMGPLDPNREVLVSQLCLMGFQKEMVVAALNATEDNPDLATQMLMDHQGILPPELLSPSPPSSSSEEPSTSSGAGSTGSSNLDADLVNEVLDDIPRHEEDYLDLTLDEESDVIAQMRSYLENCKPSS